MKTVLITGGSSGIGAALTRQCAHAGWRVFFTYRQGQSRAQHLVRELHSHPVTAIPMSLEDPESITAGMAEIAAQGNLSALVLSAAPAPQLNPLWKQTAESFNEQFAVHVLGNWRLMAECWKRFFSPASHGHVVAVLSAALGPPPWSQMSSYIVAKRALQTLLECALVEYGSSGLRASAVAPGYTETPMLTRLHPHMVEAARLKQPGGQFLKADDVARRILNQLENPPKEAMLNA